MSVRSDAAKAAARYLQFSLQWSSIALLWYDYALTFEMEMKHMWSRRLRLSTILYIFCRYALVGNVLFLLAISNKLGDSCDAWYKVISSLSQLGRAAVIITFTARTYAIWNRNRFVLAYLGLIGLACIILSWIHVPSVRCSGGLKDPLVNSLLPILMTVFEFSSFLLTSVRCLQALWAHKESLCHHRGFYILILEQGVFYFAVTSALAAVTLILNYRASPGSFMQRLLNGFNLPVACLLTARFLLHLRQYEEILQQGGNIGSLMSTHESPDHLESICFAENQMTSVIADFGGDPTRVVRQEALPGINIEMRERDQGVNV